MLSNCSEMLKGRDNPHDDVDDAPPDTTTQHNSAQHELALCILLGHREHTGGSRQDTHGTPVLTAVRRPWVAQPREHAHATQVTDTSCEHGWRPNSLVAEQGCRAPRHDSGAELRTTADHPHMVAEQSCEPRQSTMVHSWADQPTSLPRLEQRPQCFPWSSVNTALATRSRRETLEVRDVLTSRTM